MKERNYFINILKKVNKLNEEEYFPIKIAFDRFITTRDVWKQNPALNYTETYALHLKGLYNAIQSAKNKEDPDKLLINLSNNIEKLYKLKTGRKISYEEIPIGEPIQEMSETKVSDHAQKSEISDKPVEEVTIDSVVK